MFVDALRLRNRYGLAVRGHASGDRRALGQFSADLFDGRADPDRDAAVAKLGGPVLARLVVVSNRVAVPDSKAARGRRARSRVRPALRQRDGVWFGWSGKRRRRRAGAETTTVEHDDVTYVTIDLARGRLPGILQRLRQPRAVADPALPPRPRRIHAPRSRRGYLRVNEHFAEQAREAARPDDIVWVHDYHLIPLARSCASAATATGSASSCTSRVRRRKC